MSTMRTAPLDMATPGIGRVADGDDAEPAAGGSGEHPEAAMAARLLASGFAWMRFPGDLERLFQRHAPEHRLRHLLISGVLSLIVFNGFLLTDWLVAHDVLHQAVQVRLGLFTPVALLVLGFTSLWSGWVLKHLPMALIEAIVLMSSVGAAASVAYILSITHSPQGTYYHVGFLVVLMYGNVVQRLRFWYAVASSAIILAMHLWCVWHIASPEPRLIPPLVSLMLATIFFTLVANHALERDERRRFLLSLRRRHLLQQLDKAHGQLQTISRVDGLTGVFNRHHVQDYLEQTWRRAAHEGSEIAVILLDVDHFKKYNDRYGHPAGDTCLQQVARALKNSLRRPGDVVARFGGEEFIAVLPQTDAAQATQAAERVRQAIESLALRHEASDTSRVVTVSVGVGSCRATPARDSQTLVEAADRALYRAKQGGRNRVAMQRLG